MVSARRLRTVVAVLLFGALAATPVPPASATAAATVVFEGQMATNGPLSYPCLGSGTKCPVIGGNGIIGGNDRDFFFSSSVCLGAFAGTSSSPPVGGPGCSVNAAGRLNGSCGLATGEATVWVTVGGTTVLGTTTLITSFTFVDVGGTWIVTPNNPAFPVVGILEVVPVPGLSGLTLFNRCENKTATQFLLFGSLTVARP